MLQRRWHVLLLAALLICSCASPVLRKDILDQGTRNPNMAELTQAPIPHRGKLFIFGGIIASTKFTQQGSLIEGMYVPVDEKGALENIPATSHRFLALCPRSSGLLDPVIYRSGRHVTIAANFMDVRQGKLGEMEYAYPFFEIREIYLWPTKPRVYYYPFPEYVYPYPGYPGYGPWW